MHNKIILFVEIGRVSKPIFPEFVENCLSIEFDNNNNLCLMLKLTDHIIITKNV